MEFVSWVEESALGIYMLDSIWGYPIVLSAHAVGMAIVVGTVLMIDLRLVGFVGRAPLDSFKNIFFVTWIGVALNLLSGIALFASDPEKFTFHYVFWIKIGLMLAGVASGADVAFVTPYVDGSSGVDGLDVLDVVLGQLDAQRRLVELLLLLGSWIPESLRR